MFFCSNCRTLYNITKDNKGRQLGGKIKRGLENLFQKHRDGEELVDADFEEITQKDLFDDERFNNLSNKARQKMVSWIKKFNKDWFIAADDEDENEENMVTTAFFICKTCQNSKPIKAGTIICHQSFGFDESNETEDYSLSIHDQTLARTRAYICPNEKCKSHSKPDTREAVLTKNHLHQIIYICTVCEANWISST
jgi:hypothetical protein